MESSKRGDRKPFSHYSAGQEQETNLPPSLHHLTAWAFSIIVPNSTAPSVL